MPVFDIQLPDNRVLTVEAADQNAALAGAKEWHASDTSALGVAKNAVLDVPGEVADAFGAGVEQAKNLNPVSDERRALTESAGKKPFLDFSDTFKSFLNTGKGIAALPSLVGALPTGLARSLIGHPYAAVTGMPYEEAKGVVDTAMMAAAPRGVSPMGVRTVPAPAPTSAELRTVARGAYQSPEVTGVAIDPASTANLAATIQADLTQRGFRPVAGQGQRAFNATDELVPAQGAAAVSVADLDSTRKALGIAARERDPTGRPTAEATAASSAIRHIDDYLTNLGPQDVLAGDAQRAAALMTEARGNYGAAKRSEAVDAKLTRAQRQAARSGMGANVENAIRQKVGQLLDNPSATAGWSPDELAAAERVVEGTPTRNALRVLGKAGVDGGLSLLLHMGAAIPTGGMSVPVTAAGTVARVAGQALTAREAERLAELFRRRSPLALSRPQTVPVAPPPSLPVASLYPGLLSGGLQGLPILPQLNAQRR